MKLLVIGAQNIDIFAKLPENYLIGDSNIADISYAYGGVGRNIAVNLNSLGNDVHFLTVFGDDFLSQAAKKRLEELSIDIHQSKHVNNHPNSTYLAVLDEENDLHLGMNSMKIVDELNTIYIQSKKEYISQFETIVIDNNLSKDVIKYIVKSCASKTIFMDAVSAKKVHKLETLLPYIDYVKLNVLELCALTGEATLEAALLSPKLTNANTLIITNKDNHIIVKSKHKETLYEPNLIDHIVNASGAGDAFLSGFIHGVVHKYDEYTQINYALKMAKATLLYNASTNEELTLEEVERINE